MQPAWRILRISSIQARELSRRLKWTKWKVDDSGGFFRRNYVASFPVNLRTIRIEVSTIP